MLAALAVVAIVAARPRRDAAELDPFAPMRMRLAIVEGGTPRALETNAPLEIGRADTCTVVLRDPEVSRSHARLEPRQGVVYLRDLGSRNGTFLNGRRITSPIEVREGDEIDVGVTRITVEDLKPWT
ncbi:MAG: FHA domain-containing protein [bacterium]|nr:FHA domain-containing protein [bacterium]